MFSSQSQLKGGLGRMETGILKILYEYDKQLTRIRSTWAANYQKAKKMDSSLVGQTQYRDRNDRETNTLCNSVLRNMEKELIQCIQGWLVNTREYNWYNWSEVFIGDRKR